MWTALLQTQLKTKTQQLSQQWCLEETTPGIGWVRQSSTAMGAESKGPASQVSQSVQSEVLEAGYSWRVLPWARHPERDKNQLETHGPLSHTHPADLSVALTMVCVGATPGDHVLSLLLSSDSLKPGPLQS